jgi:pyruvate ferredoxin oxidoreductase beta subunit
MHTVRLLRFHPVEDYLRRQTRYQHLFHPVRQEEILRQLQDDVDRYWAKAEGQVGH